MLQVRGPRERVLVRGVEIPRIWGPGRAKTWARIAAAIILIAPLSLHAQQHFNGGKAYEYAREFAAIGPRWPTGPGHAKAEEFLRTHFKHDQSKKTHSPPIPQSGR